MTASPLLALEGVRFRWPGQDADTLVVEHLTLAPGERLFVQGPSGSGKTTLLNLLGGVIVPRAGSVTLLDTPLERLGAGQRDRFRADHVGLIFQQFNLLPYLSLLDNVLLPCRFSTQRRGRIQASGGDTADEARRLLEALGLSGDVLHRPVTALSVGQQQRVAVARALIGSPALLIADEPTSALDHGTRDRFLDLLLGEAATTGSGVVFVSHDPTLAGHFPRRLFLNGGVAWEDSL